MNLELGQNVIIQSYKHDGSLHRSWLYSTVLDIFDDYVVVYNNKTWVIEADGRRWFTREPAICFFYTNRWYNVISMIRKTGIHYYCNIASPSLYDGEAIKNIDYDLDVKIFPEYKYVILDEDEYIQHGKKMEYSDELKIVIQNQMSHLINQIEAHNQPFNEELIYAYHQKYLDLQKQV